MDARMIDFVWHFKEVKRLGGPTAYLQLPAKRETPWRYFV